jgi:hypothetical protein
MAGLVLVIGGAKLQAARPIVARALALAIPAVPVAIGVKRLEHAKPELERAASAVAWLTILAGEASVVGSFFEVGLLAPAVPWLRWVLYGACLAALVINTLDARAEGKARFGAYVGVAAGFAVYLTTQHNKDPFGAVFGAFFAGFLVGGGALLLVGEALARVFKKA